VRTASREFYENFRVSPGETENALLYELGNRQWNIPELRRRLQEILTRDGQFSDFEVEHEFKHLGNRTMILNARRLLQADGGTPSILLAIEDITERKLTEASLRQGHADLQSHAEELTRFNKVAVGRETRMIELKKEVNELCQRHGEAARYPLEFEQDGEDPQP
jgi:hypothetical protein